MKQQSAIIFLIISLAAILLGQDITEQRRRDLEHFLKTFLPSKTPPTGRINAIDKTWEDWVRRTGELPPDFDVIPTSRNCLTRY